MDTTETAQDGEASRMQQQPLPRLRLLYTPPVGITDRTYLLPVGTSLLGRKLPDGDGVDLSDNQTSRLHATLHVSAELQLSIVDEDSKNGTAVNGKTLSSSLPLALKDGDIVRAGHSFFIVRYEPLQSLPDYDFHALIGVAPKTRALRYRLRRVATDRAAVLLLGETGTGKEVAAQALHEWSGRSGEFIAVNCAAIPESLAESLLFGHVQGAFTGARAQPGCFLAANGGTLFLDELGELPLHLQAKLLRVLQERKVTPVGSVKAVPFDVRFVAATNRDLEAAERGGTFRQDLYARLSEVVVNLPPLRDRREDILPLLCHELGDAGRSLKPTSIEKLLLYTWPLNVREVQHCAKHLRLFGDDEELLSRLGAASAGLFKEVQLPASSDASYKAEQNPHSTQGEQELTSYHGLVALMRQHHGVIRQVAESLGCSRRQVGRMLDGYRIDRHAFRPRSAEPQQPEGSC